MSEEHVCVEGVDALTLTEDRTPSTPASEAKEIEDSDDFVDPWNVASKNETGVDYDKLISELSRPCVRSTCITNLLSFSS